MRSTFLTGTGYRYEIWIVQVKNLNISLIRKIPARYLEISLQINEIIKNIITKRKVANRFKTYDVSLNSKYSSRGSLDSDYDWTRSATPALHFVQYCYACHRQCCAAQASLLFVKINQLHSFCGWM